MAQHEQVRRIFVTIAALALATFIVAQAISAVNATGPLSRARELMPVIGAERVDRELGQVATYPMELPEVIGGKQVMATLSEIPGDTVVFLNFWGTFCKPCVDELPSMLRLRRKLAGRPFKMIAVSYDEEWAAIRSFFDRVLGGMPTELVITRDPNEEEADQMRTLMGTSLIPDTYILRRGEVIAKFVNQRDWMDPKIVEYFLRLTDAP